MSKLKLALFIGVIGAGGCLPDPVPIEGKQLFAGRDIENMSFIKVAGKTHVLFETRLSLPTAVASGLMDMWTVPLDGSAPAKRFFAGRVEGDWGLIGLGGDVPQYWVARNERTVSVAQRSVRVTDAIRVDVNGNVLEQVRDVFQFSRQADGLVFRRPSANGAVLAYHYRNKAGLERVLDDLTGGVTFSGAGLYYVGGPDLTLYWVPNLMAPAEPLRAGVTRSRFLGDNLAIMTVPENGKPVDVLVDLGRKTERKLPGARICCWLDVGANRDIWRYAESRNGMMPAVYHEYNYRTGEHQERPLPAALTDLIRIVPRPNSDASLLFDSAGNLAIDDPAREPRAFSIPLRAPSPRFSDDGKFLLYVRPTSQVPSPEGPLFIQDSDFAAPERQVSPLGTTLLLSSFFTLEEPAPPLVVFWARFGKGASDLYFADFTQPMVTRVAESIRDVSVTRERVVGIVRTSLQDLVGDLVIKDLVLGTETIVGRSVDSYILTDDSKRNLLQMVYVLRTRKTADVEGLWLAELPPP
ncbi:MAG: hypothetical protein SF187_06325 [Deltaproteobacteria bacterium]|nr:hypothetical protein [Deltaproteobacteria bacterium]